MLITRRDNVKKPIEHSPGVLIYKMIGRPENLGGTTKHSISCAVMQPNSSSRKHYHPENEETYYILKGKAKLIIDEKTYHVNAGDAILLEPSERHQIFAEGEENLEFMTITAPAWQPTSSVYLDK